jgi:hypothetical protein
VLVLGDATVRQKSTVILAQSEDPTAEYIVAGHHLAGAFSAVVGRSGKVVETYTST